MNRLLTVVNERKRLRSEYRKYLEDQYIAMRKKQEEEETKAEIERLRAQGIKTVMTEDEVKAMLKAKREKRLEDYNIILEKLKTRSSESVIEPMLSEKDMKLVAATQAKLTQSEILRMYVKNYAELGLKQRRQVLAKIQSQRAMHAKEIFLKELSAIGKRMKKQDWAKEEKSRVKDKRDPLKLKLEAISLSDIEPRSSTQEQMRQASQ